MNALSLLKQDHRTVLGLFRRFEKASEGARREKGLLARQIVKELSVHAAIEEELFYPAARARDERLNELVLEALEEHHVAKWTLDEIDRMSPEDERFEAKVIVLAETIRHHIRVEEETLFPRIRQVMGSAELEALGAALAQAKRFAPTHPHPLAPDTPPGNRVTGKLARILDLGRDATVEAAHRARKALIATRSRSHPRRPAEAR